MKFIRKNGHIIPIHDKLNQLGKAEQVAGAGVAGYGAYKAIKHAANASKQFNIAVAARHFGGTLGANAYTGAKRLARTHAKSAISGAKLINLGAGLAIVGIATSALSRLGGSKKKRGKYGR
jgi:hypothetical protein